MAVAASSRDQAGRPEPASSSASPVNARMVNAAREGGPGRAGARGARGDTPLSSPRWAGLWRDTQALRVRGCAGRRRGQRSQLTADPRASPAHTRSRRSSAARRSASNEEMLAPSCDKAASQAAISRPPVRRSSAAGCCSRGPAAGPDAIRGRAPAATSSRLSAAAALSTISFSARSASYGLVGASGRSAAYTRHCTAWPTRIGTRPTPGRTGHHRLAVLERGPVECGRPAQRTQRAGHRQGQEPALGLDPFQPLQGLVQAGRGQRVQTEYAVRVEDVMGHVGAEHRPARPAPGTAGP